MSLRRRLNVLYVMLLDSRAEDQTQADVDTALAEPLRLVAEPGVLSFAMAGFEIVPKDVVVREQTEAERREKAQANRAALSALKGAFALPS